jgi:hypothetical protein
LAKADAEAVDNIREEDLAIQFHDMLREQYEQTCKIFFILRD